MGSQEVRQIVAIAYGLRIGTWIETDETLLGPSQLTPTAYARLKSVLIIAQMGDYRAIIRATDTNAVEMSG